MSMWGERAVRYGLLDIERFLPRVLRPRACPSGCTAAALSSCEKQGWIDQSDCTRTANPRPLADPVPEALAVAEPDLVKG